MAAMKSDLNHKFQLTELKKTQDSHDWNEMY